MPGHFELRQPLSISLNVKLGGVCWTKFETISGRIQMIKTTNADEAGRNNLSGGMDSPCLG
ncbi:MAG: hypothetical protein A3E60_00760 [Candidatus Kerfeldbacteria bacterium RIFCSPHIGHO2_12_FULL_42_13]|nr:MAG: hypothetical protein A3E60_00760 [Candidatus Kerfeldbacteria bacterium RIFCSPHIGHO2_12_FULL_42_13]